LETRGSHVEANSHRERGWEPGQIEASWKEKEQTETAEVVAGGR